MKTNVLIFLLSIFSIIGCRNSGKLKESTSPPNVETIEKQVERESPKEVISNFYKDYITIQDSPPSPENREGLISIKEKYLTKELVSKIEKEALDYDPLINAQDASLSWLETLEIEEINTSKKYYSVCYVNSYDGARKCINLKIIAVNNSYKISDILDENLLISNEYNVSDKEVYLKNRINFSYYIEPIEDIRTTIKYTIENFDKNLVVFKRESYSHAFEYECTKKTNHNILLLYYKKTIEGEEYKGNISRPLVKIYKKGNDFYAVSSFIEEGKEIKLKKNSY